MCAVIGALLWDLNSANRVLRANHIIQHIMKASHERGRDGRGWMVNSSAETEAYYLRDVTRAQSMDDIPVHTYLEKKCVAAVVIGNVRAEPTTEYVLEKQLYDQQPYSNGKWSVVHNGTIANDAKLRTGELPTRIDSAAIVEMLGKYTFNYLDEPNLNSAWFARRIQDSLKGSYAIIANHSEQVDRLFIAVNYRPIWYIHTEYGLFFASSRDYFPNPERYVPKMIEPYTVCSFWIDNNSSTGYGHSRSSLYIPKIKDFKEVAPKALAVCSGGLDSVVSACKAIADGCEVELIHFLYGCRAEEKEVEAVKLIADELGVKLNLFPMPIYNKSDSPLFDKDSKVAGGEEGAEFAHEWVPARNLVLLSLATAFAEANGFDLLVLGNNLEEAGAYPDNEPEFINKFNDMLPFAVGDGKRVRVVMPVGNLMKHEIVALGYSLNAPLHLTWSCYRHGDKHCGKCGPCFMRKTAFEINWLKEVIEYEA
jgi:7-cyano-7-deazaguanine synthase